MRILGIDPGTAITGYGILDINGNKFQVVDYGAILTPSNLELAVRLEKIYKEIINIIESYQPDHLAIEELFFNKNTKTALAVGHARGVIILAGSLKNLVIEEYTPLQVKQAVVGYGRAEKRQVQEMVRIMLKLEKIPKPDDVADALALAICHAHSYNFNKIIKVK